jgi:hypothetical protein
MDTRSCPGYNHLKTDALTPGTRLGPYEILASIGAGGMEEVYRTLDTRVVHQNCIRARSRRGLWA